MKYISLIVLIIFSSCKTEEDKYPDMIVFDPNMRGEFIFEEIEPIPEYYRDTDNYVFFLTHYSIPKSKILIYNKKSKKLLETLALANDEIHINSDGVIYDFNEKKENVYKYSPPEYAKTLLEKDSLNYLSDENLENKYASEIESKKLEGEKLRNFLEEKRHEILKKKIIDTLLCITKLYKSNGVIAHYKNKEVYLNNGNYLYQGTIIKSKLNGIRDCNNSSNSELDKTSYFNENPLNLFDSVTLDYNLTGSNHFVIGVDSSNLFYYELILKNKSIKFKSPHLIRNIVNFEGLVVLETVNKYFKVSITE